MHRCCSCQAQQAAGVWMFGPGMQPQCLACWMDENYQGDIHAALVDLSKAINAASTELQRRARAAAERRAQALGGG